MIPQGITQGLVAVIYVHALSPSEYTTNNHAENKINVVRQLHGINRIHLFVLPQLLNAPSVSFVISLQFDGCVTRTNEKKTCSRAVATVLITVSDGPVYLLYRSIYCCRSTVVKRFILQN
jgi:hypothetical protein